MRVGGWERPLGLGNSVCTRLSNIFKYPSLTIQSLDNLLSAVAVMYLQSLLLPVPENLWTLQHQVSEEWAEGRVDVSSEGDKEYQVTRIFYRSYIEV